MLPLARFICFGLVGLLSAAGIVAAQSSIEGPILGFIPDNDGTLIWPIIGVPGASILADPIKFNADVRGAVISPLLIEIDRIVHLGTHPPRARNAVADGDSFDCMDRENRLTDPPIELLGPLHVRSEADRDCMRGDDDRAAESLPRFLRGIDGFDHLRFVFALHGAQRGILIDGRKLLPGR